MFRFSKMNGGGITKAAEAVASIWPNSVEKMQPVGKFYPFFLLHCKRKPWLSETCFACRILCENKAPSNSAGDLRSEPPNAKVGVAVVVVVVFGSWVLPLSLNCSLAPFELFTGPLWPLLRATQCQGGCCCCCCFLWFYPSLWIVHCPLWPLFRATQWKGGRFVFCKISQQTWNF